MNFLVLPFVAEHQRGESQLGPLINLLARQLPSLVADRISELGMPVSFVPLIAERGRCRAHVVLRSPFASEPLQDMMCSEGYSIAMTGTLTLIDSEITVQPMLYTQKTHTEPNALSPFSHILIEAVVERLAELLADPHLPSNDPEVGPSGGDQPQNRLGEADAMWLMLMKARDLDELVTNVSLDDANLLTRTTMAWARVAYFGGPFRESAVKRYDALIDEMTVCGRAGLAAAIRGHADELQQK